MAATQKVTSKEIGEIVHDAIVVAHEEYEVITHGDWLGTGPEYYLTVAIARHLFEKLGKEYPVILEHPIQENNYRGTSSLVEKRRGRNSDALRAGGRVDCVLLDPDWETAAAIEVKIAAGKRGIEKDIERLIKILSRAPHDFPCLFAYWAAEDSLAAEDSEASKATMEAWARKIDRIVDGLIQAHNDKPKSKRLGRLNPSLKTVEFCPDEEPATYLAYCTVIERGEAASKGLANRPQPR